MARITANPASLSVIRYTPLRPFVVHVNHTGADFASGLMPAPATPEDGQVPAGDAVVGGSS